MSSSPGLDPDDTAGGRSWWAGLRDRWRVWHAHAQELGRRHETTASVVRFLLAPSTLDRCFVLAAQIFLTAVPALIAVTAFVPPAVRDRIRESVSSQLGIQGSAAQAVTAFVSGDSGVREAVGIVGVVFALLSATSLTRRLQRLYEAQWSMPPARMMSSAGRWIGWVLLWIVVLAMQGTLRDGDGFWRVAGWTASAAMSVGLWWWTPHLLLLRRIRWGPLLPTALITGGSATLVAIGSRVVMPTVTGRSVAEYGPFGLVLTLMSWLLVVAGVIVVGAGAGHIVATGRGAAENGATATAEGGATASAASTTP